LRFYERLNNVPKKKKHFQFLLIFHSPFFPFPMTATKLRCGIQFSNYLGEYDPRHRLVAQAFEGR
jgi:hypothetical protein